MAWHRFWPALLSAILIPAPAEGDGVMAVGPPGDYTIHATGTVRMSWAGPQTITLDWSGTAPPPGPEPPQPPPPPPPPPPGPAVKPTWMTLIYDPALDTSATGEMKDDPTFLLKLEKLGIDRVHYIRRPCNDPYVASHNLAPTVAAVGLPCLILQDKDGRLVGPKALKVNTTDDILKVIQ